LHNTEHVFGLRVPAGVAVRLAPGEHVRLRWLPWRQAAGEVFSWSNRRAILMLPEKDAQATREQP
jgi:dATP pyrophosphohydrolase